MTETATQATEKAWHQLVHAHHAVLSAVEQSLKRNGFPPLVWHNCLLELTRSETGTRRPVDLERSLLLPQYGLSRLLARIEAAGYIRRDRDRQDRRAQIVAITDEGRALCAAMGPVYAAALASALGEKLEEKQARKLTKVLKRVTE